MSDYEVVQWEELIHIREFGEIRLSIYSEEVVGLIDLLSKFLPKPEYKRTVHAEGRIISYTPKKRKNR